MIFQSLTVEKRMYHMVVIHKREYLPIILEINNLIVNLLIESEIGLNFLCNLLYYLKKIA